MEEETTEMVGETTEEAMTAEMTVEETVEETTAGRGPRPARETLMAPVRSMAAISDSCLVPGAPVAARATWMDRDPSMVVISD